MHPVEPWSLVGAGQWAVCLHGRDFPVSGSRLLSTEQMPPENIKRKRKETVKSLYFWNDVSEQFFKNRVLFLQIPGNVDLANILHLLSSWLVYEYLGKFWH